MRCSECERPVLVIPLRGRKRSRKARAGIPVSIKDHDLCAKCWERAQNQFHAARLLREQELEINAA